MGKLLSVIMPIYNETSIEKNTLRVMNVLNENSIDYEIILIDDGSTNGAWNEISALAEKNKCITAVALSRNFGKENALCAGLDMAIGDCAVCIDSDMQFPPEVIPKMYKLWQEGYEVVEGVKNQRQNEKFAYRFCTNLFYGTLKKFSRIDLKNASDFRLLDRLAIDAWKSMPEKQTFFRGMSSWVGFKRTQILFDVADREEGSTKWSLRSLVSLAINAVTSYTTFPLYISVFCGFIFLFFSLIMFIQTVYMKLSGHALEGFTTIILLQCLIGAISMFSMGMMGIYIKKIYEEVKCRPRYIIRRVLNKKTGDDK